ncbi:MAG: type II secretion system protein [Candidatus Eisenbacteria bacterium]|nr:type II secretion system protein [Candidatus Eisenbacteria bacterium]
MPAGLARNGYTMVELVLVIAIIGILAASSIPAWFDRGRTNLDITRRRLVGDLTYAREYAMLRHDHVSANFSVAGNSYTIYYTPTGAAITDPSDTRGNLSFTLNGSSYSGGVAITNANFGGTPGVRFNSWGTPCDSAGNVLTTMGLVILTGTGSSTYTDTVRVEPGTGYVR